MSTRCLRGVNVALGAGDGASVPARSAGIQLPTCRNPGAGAAWGACTEVQVQDGAEQGPAPNIYFIEPISKIQFPYRNIYKYGDFVSSHSKCIL